MTDNIAEGKATVHSDNDYDDDTFGVMECVELNDDLATVRGYLVTDEGAGEFAVESEGASEEMSVEKALKMLHMTDGTLYEVERTDDETFEMTV